MTGVILVLIIIVGAELAIRDGFQPIRTLGQAASGQLELR